MRVARPAALLAVLAALLAGCGGNEITADEVPVEPPVLTIPSDPDAAPGATASGQDAGDDQQDDAESQGDGADATPTPDPGAAATAAPPAGGTTGGAGAGGATATPAPQQEQPENTGGAQADEGLDQFCADNPGAC